MRNPLKGWRFKLETPSRAADLSPPVGLGVLHHHRKPPGAFCYASPELGRRVVGAFDDRRGNLCKLWATVCDGLRRQSVAKGSPVYCKRLPQQTSAKDWRSRLLQLNSLAPQSVATDCRDRLSTDCWNRLSPDWFGNAKPEEGARVDEPSGQTVATVWCNSLSRQSVATDCCRR